MTSVLDSPDVATASARRTITAGDAWRKARLPVGLGLLLVAVAVAQAILTGTVGANYLDPTAAKPAGGRALAQLLRDHGIEVERVAYPTGRPGTTVFVPVPQLVQAVRPEALAATGNAADLVIAHADDAAIEAARVRAEVSGDSGERVRDPGCEHPDAVAAGKALLGGFTYGAPEDATVCYLASNEPTFVDLTSGGRHVTLLGTALFMTNKELDEEGNAALALRLLTRNPRVEWVYPAAGEIEVGGDEGILDLLPHRWFVLVAQLSVALLLLALWRARRLGPVVTEPLPVVVRAAETVEGRARLYEAARRRDQAANALRAGLRDRLVRLLGLAPDAGADTIVAAVTARTSRDAVAVTDLLYGPPPTDDAALVRLAADLDRLDSEVRSL